MLHSTSDRTKLRALTVFCTMFFSVILSACIDTKDKDNERNQNPRVESSIIRNLSGTVAVGAPAVGTVTVIDADGNTQSSQSDASGNYTINLADMSGPYLIRAVPADSALPEMYSFATGAGIANVTPFTQLALFLAYRTSLQTAFDSWSTLSANWKRADLEDALAQINANFHDALLNAGVDPNTYDFFTTPFAADHSGIDAFLDGYSVSVDSSGNTYEITDTSGQAVTFDENVDTTDYYIGASFIPDNSALWSYTITTISDGRESTSTQDGWPGYLIPWNLERFNEYYWSALSAIPKEVSTCENNPQANCSISFEVTQLESSYDVIGNGEIGTRVTATGAYSWRISGWYQYSVLPRQDIDETHSWSYTWVWERTQ